MSVLLKLALMTTLSWAPLMAGKRLIFFLPAKPGHYQVTEDLAREFGFSRPAQRLLADAAMDPDYYDWKQAAAHAQTSNDLQGKQSETQEEAKEQLYAWLDDKLDKVQAQLQLGHPREALYWLGYSLHAIEDLASHQGITNAEHSYLSAMGHNPDLQPGVLNRAHDLSKAYLWAVWDKLGDPAWKTLLHESQGPLNTLEKEQLLGHGWDINLGEMLIYRAQGKFYAHQQSAQRSQINWDSTQIIKAYLARLKTRK